MHDDLSLTFSAPSEDVAEAPSPPRIYLVGRPGPARDRWSALPELAAAQVGGPESWRREDFDDPGLVLFLVEEMSGTELVQGLDWVARGRGEWLPVIGMVDDDGAFGVRPLSLGYAHSLEEALQANQDRGSVPKLLELREVVARISVARHDINNPLTSGLAETQLLLMDFTEGEPRAALETIQRQFRRVRDMIKELQPLRLTDT